MQLRNGSWCVVLLLLGRVAAAQPVPADTLAPELPAAAWHVSSELDSAGACTEVLRWGTPAALVRTFYPGGQLHEYLPFANLAAGTRHGVASTWYASGQAQVLEPFVAGRREGELLLYYEDGRLKRQAGFRDGLEQHSRCYDASGRPVPYFPYEQPPLCPGGLAQLNQDINRRLRWTRELSRQALPGRMLVGLSFLVNTDGHLSEWRVEVPSGVPLLDQAVLQAVAQLRQPWQPGRRDGQLLAFRYRLPIEFKVAGPARPFRRL